MAAPARTGHGESEFRIRPALDQDGPALRLIDVEAFIAELSAAPAPQPHDEFFDERTRPECVLVAEVGGVPVGWVVVRERYPRLDSAAHVKQIRGLAVTPRFQRLGVGQRLVMAAVELARARGARRLTLSVLGANGTARRLYERCGFAVVGIEREQFLIAGRYLDDVLMDLDVTNTPAQELRGAGRPLP